MCVRACKQCVLCLSQALSIVRGCRYPCVRTCARACALSTLSYPVAVCPEPKTGGGLQTSAYIESLLEQVFLPLFEVMSVVPVEEQVVLLYWHTNLVCSGYKKAITANAKSYRYMQGILSTCVHLCIRRYAYGMLHGALATSSIHIRTYAHHT